MTTGIEFDGVTHRFGSTTALDGVELTIRPGVITGLVGRNGAGKSTLCGLGAALMRPQHGTVRLGGRPVWENPDAVAQVCLMRDRGSGLENLTLRSVVGLHRTFRPQWDEQTFERLLRRFDVPDHKWPSRLSTGQRSALRIALALASRAEVTLLDEVHLGLDAVARRWFYEEVLADYTRHPRTIVLSSHLLEEIEQVVEDVVVVHRGRILASGDVDTVRAEHAVGAGLPSLTDVLVSLTDTRTDPQTDTEVTP